MDPKEQSISRQAEKALREAVDEVVEEARRTNGTVVVWEDGAVSAYFGRSTAAAQAALTLTLSRRERGPDIQLNTTSPSP